MTRVLASDQAKRGPDGLAPLFPPSHSPILTNLGTAAPYIPTPEEQAAHRAEQPLVAQGPTREDAIASMINELRLYSASWPMLAGTPEHAGNWPLAQFIAVSTAEQLSAWIEREAAASR